MSGSIWFASRKSSNEASGISKVEKYNIILNICIVKLKMAPHVLKIIIYLPKIRQKSHSVQGTFHPVHKYPPKIIENTGVLIWIRIIYCGLEYIVTTVPAWVLLPNLGKNHLLETHVLAHPMKHLWAVVQLLYLNVLIVYKRLVKNDLLSKCYFGSFQMNTKEGMSCKFVCIT